jgi:hypothetical protein
MCYEFIFSRSGKNTLSNHSVVLNRQVYGMLNLAPLNGNAFGSIFNKAKQWRSALIKQQL